MMPQDEMLFLLLLHLFYCSDPSRLISNTKVIIIIALRNFTEFANSALYNIDCPIISALEPFLETPRSSYKWLRSPSKLELIGRNQDLKSFFTKATPNFDTSLDWGEKRENQVFWIF